MDKKISSAEHKIKSRARRAFTASHKGVVLIPQVTTAFAFFQRAAGLLGREEWPEGCALWIRPCPSVHTFFMRFSLDIIFLDREYRVARRIPHARPWRCFSGGHHAHSVLELAAGWLSEDALTTGDVLEFEEITRLSSAWSECPSSES